MQVLFVGLFKTGTKTMNKALEILGYKVSELSRNNDELINTWWKFFDGRGTPNDLKVMFEGYDAAGDAPSSIFWRDFLKAYPRIKVSSKYATYIYCCTNWTHPFHSSTATQLC